MPDTPHITIHPVTAKGGRPVTAHAHGTDTPLGTAHSLADVLEFARRAGLDDPGALIDRNDPVIVWTGGGPDTWT
ncbi:hypothetical protein ACFV7Q_20410 [Streptomyces sp. NPDC059851]|uniref:hypothetical protein n=1 Tax=Streptomyces sp. NPDC059851 TaxID=3346971 RepID=UPI00364C3DC3